MSAHTALAPPLPGLLKGSLALISPTRRRVSMAAAFSALLIGAVALAGWLIAPDPLGSAIFWNLNVKASTSVAFIALGASLLLLLRVPGFRRRTMVVGSLLAAAGIVATLALVEYVARVQVGVDTLLFPDHTATAAPARMSIGTSIGLLLLAGSGATLLVARLRGRLTVALCTLVAAIAALAVLGHVFAATELQGVDGPTPFALTTPLGILLIAISILAHPQVRGPFDVLARRSHGGHVARTILMISLIVLPLIALIRVIGEAAGLYSFGLGVALMTTAAAALLGGVGIRLGSRLDQAERARHSAERSLQHVISETDEAVFVVGPEGTFRELNPAWARMLGFEPGEMLHRPFVDYVHPADVQTAMTGWADVLERGHTSLGLVNRYWHRDGSVRSIEWAARRDFDSGLVYAVARDITARAEQEGEHALLAAIVASTGDAVTSSDLDGRILTWNPAAERLYGYPAGEVIGRQFSFLIPPERPDEVVQRFSQMMNRVSVEAWDTIRMARDGRRIPVSITVAPLRDAAGILMGASVITRDNTDIKEATDRLEAANTALAARNAELRDFTSVVSHDLRAPLRRLQLFSEMAANVPGKDAEVSDLLERIRSSAGRMEALVVDLLTLARLGESATAMQQVDLAQIAAEAVEMQQTAITVSRGVVGIGELPVIDGEPGLLRQLFINLIGNAVKFARPGARPEVTLAGQALPADASGRRFAEVSVSDNGIGFDAQYAERIFGIFERLSTDEAGTGIGLAICKKGRRLPWRDHHGHVHPRRRVDLHHPPAFGAFEGAAR